jgi:hypothetical protein
VFIRAVARVCELSFGRQSRGRREKKESGNPSIKNFWLHQFSTLGITFLHWPLEQHFFGAYALSEALSKTFQKFF